MTLKIKIGVFNFSPSSYLMCCQYLISDPFKKKWCVSSLTVVTEMENVKFVQLSNLAKISEDLNFLDLQYLSILPSPYVGFFFVSV